MSANIGLAPELTIEDTEAMNVLEVTITSSPLPIFKALKARSIATVPFGTAIACLVPT